MDYLFPCDYEVDNHTLDEYEIQQFNSQFTQFEGDKVRDSTVNVLLNKVITTNLSANNDASRQIEVVFSDSLNMKPLLQNDTTFPKIKAGAIYEVTCEISQEGQDKGLVYCILVTKVGDAKPQPIHTAE